MKTIFLIGFMGCGKSTIAERMENKLHMTVVDTDSFIEEKYNQKIKDIFATYGEKRFRQYETNAIKEVSSFQVVSTGGGIVEKEENITAMRSSGFIIYLQTPFMEIVRRLKNDQTRPLWNNELIGEMEALYKRRVQMYEKYADYTIDTHNKTTDEMIDEMKKFIKEE